MKAILDTGPWVALIDRSESMHESCVQWFKDYTGKLYSTEAVLTEVLYLLIFSIEAQSAAINFVLKAVVEVIPTSVESLDRAKNMMRRYSDLPMDYADATIVCLAIDTGIQNVITFDKKEIKFMRRLIKDSEKKIYLILDNLKVHHSYAVQDWFEEYEEEIEVFFLPSYSPELNPDEYLNCDLKAGVHSGTPARTKGQLKTKAISHLRKLQKLPKRVMKYFKHPKIVYAR